MKGRVNVSVKNKHISFNLVLERNITIITGDSGTGKTKLINMIRDYSEEGKASGVSLSCEKACLVLEGKNWETILSDTKDSVVFIEEGNKFVKSSDFANAAQNSDNYYVIVTREPLPQLPYGIEAINEIEKHGKTPKIKKTYTNISVNDINSFSYDVIIVEDSNSGFQVFKAASAGKVSECISAYGKTKIVPLLRAQKGKRTLVIADAAALGAEIHDICEYKEFSGEQIDLFLPECFEWLVLKAHILGNDSNVNNILSNPIEYIYCEKYFSWEQFFEATLVAMSKGKKNLQYKKAVIAPGYLQKANIEKIINAMK